MNDKVRELYKEKRNISKERIGTVNSYECVFCCVAS